MAQYQRRQEHGESHSGELMPQRKCRGDKILATQGLVCHGQSLVCQVNEGPVHNFV